jgi:hypothetical protein
VYEHLSRFPFVLRSLGVVAIVGLVILPFKVSEWIYDAKRGEPIPDSVRVADSIAFDSFMAADSAFDDSVDRGLIRVIQEEEPEPTIDNDEW